MQPERYRQDPQRRRRFILRALRLTRAPMTTIAKRAGYKKSAQVYEINMREGIRDPALARAICKEAELRKLAAKRRRIALFSDLEKAELIKTNLGLILLFARSFWSAIEIRKEYPDFDDFLNEIKTYVAESLDYYDPEKVGKKTGKTTKVSTWIGNYVKWFCFNKYRSLRKQRLRQMPVNSAGEEIEPVRRLTPVESKKPSGWELARVPVRARSLLRNLGLNIDVVAKMGYGPVRDLITRIALDPETKLNAKETFVILGRLDAKELEEIGKEFAGKFGREVTKEAVRRLQVKAIVKIKKNWKPSAKKD
jgi:hypothetical protein